MNRDPYMMLNEAEFIEFVCAPFESDPGKAQEIIAEAKALRVKAMEMLETETLNDLNDWLIEQLEVA